MRLINISAVTRLQLMFPNLADYQITVQSSVEVFRISFDPHQAVFFTVIYPMAWVKGLNLIN